MRKYSFYLGVFSICLLILSGCGKLDRKGVPSTNAAPKVYFANIPPESTYFSVNPKVHWFGTDIDGFITAYQYGIMVTDSVVSRGGLDQVKSELHQIPPDSASWVEQTSLKNMIGVHLQAEPGGHSRNVMMFADIVDTIYTPQYIFVRAIDNRRATSEVISMMFYRNNHRPEAIIEVSEDFATKNHYCLEETTFTWKGISISWSGLDLEDYPNERDQPEFDFKWELIGPFDSLPGLDVDTTAVVDSSLDSVLIAGQWIYSRWVSEKIHLFKGLENFPEEPGEAPGADSGYGWYQLRVRARDDAFVSTDTATTLNFRILKPKFCYTDSAKKTILVVDATAYGGKKGGAADPADVRPFYEDALEYFFQSDLCDESQIWYDPLLGPGDVPKDAPGEDVLSRYDLTIVLNLGSDPGITEDNFKQYKEYLNVGGRLWIIGLNNFRLGRGREKTHSLEEELRSSAVNTYEVGTQYCGIEEVFVPSWTILDSMTLEFIRAESFGLWEEELQTLEVDPVKCQVLTGYDSTLPAQNFGARGIPRVCYVTMSNYLDFEYRTPAQRRIFSFISYYGTPPMHERPVAVNYIGSTYRTAVFSFPLNLMKNESPDEPVFEVMGKMVKWFFPEFFP